MNRLPLFSRAYIAIMNETAQSPYTVTATLDIQLVKWMETH